MTGLISNLGRACGLILIFAALVKAFRFESFANWIHSVVEPAPALGYAAVCGIIAAECAIGSLVVWRPHRGAPFAVVLFALFAIIHIRLLGDPMLVACPCFADLLPATTATQLGLLVMSMAALAVQIRIMSIQYIHNDQGD